MNKNQVIELNPLSLASVGDAFHTLVVRKTLLEKDNLPANKLHLLASSHCCAKNQSKIFDKIFESLTQEEKAIALRARNHKSHAVKSSTQIEYKKATAFEALIGFLFLTNNAQKAKEIIQKSMLEEL